MEDQSQENVADCVLKFLWQGSVKSLLDIEMMCSVDAIISIVKPKNLHSFRTTKPHLIIPVQDGDEELFEWFEIAFNFLDEFRRSGRSVLVHCMAGHSRSSALIIAYMMERLDFISYEQALAALRVMRPSVILQPNYERRLQKLGTIVMGLKA